MRKILRTTFTILIILLVCFIVLEFLLQLSFNQLPDSIKNRMPQAPVRYGIRYDTQHGAREYPANEDVSLVVDQYSGDLYRITCLSPDTAPEFEPYTVEYTRDSHGFRNTEPWDEHPDLVVLGDSFVAAESIQEPFWNLPDQSVVAFGLPGSGTLEQSLLFDEFSQSITPDQVVLAYFGGNDISDSVRFNEAQSAGNNLYDFANSNRQIWEYSVIFQILMLLRDSTTSGQQDNACPYPMMLEDGQAVAFYDQFLENSQMTQDELLDSEDFKITQNAILSIANRAEEIGADFTLLYIPHKAEVYWALLSSDQQAMLDLSTEQLDAQRNVLKDLAKENDFDFLDLTASFQRGAERGAERYFYSDTHWNQEGHDLAKRILQDRIISD